MLVATIFLFLGLSRYHELTAMKAAGDQPLPGERAHPGRRAAHGRGRRRSSRSWCCPSSTSWATRSIASRSAASSRAISRPARGSGCAARTARFYRVELVAPGTERPLRHDRPGGGPRLPSDPAARCPAGALDAAGLGHPGRRRPGRSSPTGQVETAPFAVTDHRAARDHRGFHGDPEAPLGHELPGAARVRGPAGGRGLPGAASISSISTPSSPRPWRTSSWCSIAIPFALQSPRGGRLFGIGLAIAIMVGYLVLDRAALAFSRAEMLPPLLGAWTANIIFLGIGASLFVRART